VKSSICILVLWFCAFVAADGQECPKSNANDVSSPSETQTLQGQLIYHDSLRQWFELKLDAPRCGQKSIQLVTLEGNWTTLEVLRGCHVRSEGTIGDSLTGYYSLDLYQDVTKIEASGACEKKKPFPDMSKLKPVRDVRRYQVEMLVDYEEGDHPIVFRITSYGKELQPWQAYASYDLTGGFVLYGHCGEGFVVDKLFGTPEANPRHFDEPRTPSDMAAFDPESAASTGKKNLRLGYTCVRSR
jgi:hypothetical protein